MQGKTHAAIGVATALLIMQPKTINELALGTGVAIIGSLLPDVDTSRSKAARAVSKLVLAIGVGLVAFLCFGKYIKLDNTMIGSDNIGNIIGGACILLGVSIIGYFQPHRGFMHSLVALMLTSIGVEIMAPQLLVYYVIGFASHLVLDVTNYKGEQLLWPIQAPISLQLCKSDGVANTILCVIGPMLSFGAIAYLLTSRI